MRGWRAASAVALSCSALMLLATAEFASAAVVSTDNGSGGAGNTRLLVTDTYGANNVIVITGAGPLVTESYTVNDSVGAATSDSDCSQTDSTHVKCTMNSPLIRVDAGDGDDQVTISVATASVRFRPATLIGGDGYDTLTGNYADNELLGGPGNDTMTGSLGADTFDGGPAGRDTVSYADRTSPSTVVTATIGDGTNDGETGEGDVLANVENVIGGAGPDHLAGDSGANLLIGGAGDDEILGGGGNDSDYAYLSAGCLPPAGTLFAGLIGGIGNDHLVGGIGTDGIRGGDGDDRLEGGGGEDRFVSFDGNGACDAYNGGLDGEAGADLLIAFDGPPDSFPESDDLTCGADPDSYIADVGDDAINPDCETNADPDADGIPASVDNCPTAANPDQADVDGDGLGDACDPTDDRPPTGSTDTSQDGTAGTQNTANPQCQLLRKKLKKARTKAAKKKIRRKLRALGC
jgi:Ca2+-binding RTX toxin-like protein